MRIAMMVRGYLTAPHPIDIWYAPIDLAINIADGLTKRGHKVDFYAPVGSRMRSNIVNLGLPPLIHNYAEFQQMLSTPNLLTHYVPGSWDNYYAVEMFKKAKAGAYDLLYFVHPEVALPFAKLFPNVPVAYTLHDPIYPWYRNIFKMYHTENQFFISISNNQRLPARNLNYVSTIYNGIDIEKFPYSEKPQDFLLYYGRIVPEKGVREAVQVAQRTKSRLKIIGPIFPDSRPYFDKYIKPHLNDRIQYLGYLKPDRAIKYYGRAKAFLCPLQWEEPFGVTMIESMASGTPVIALRRGSAPELIKDGKTGFLVDSVSEMVKAVNNIDKINRLDCRQHVESNFTTDIMVDNYEAAFKDIIRSKKIIKPLLTQPTRLLRLHKILGLDIKKL